MVPIHKLTRLQRHTLNQCMRVNHAGEVGANFIYRGQLSFVPSSLKPTIQHMKDQELVHMDTFNRLLPETNTRPSLLLPLWKMSGFLLGSVTALGGKEMAMLCTDAVETSISKHYNDQLRILIELENEVDPALKSYIQSLQQTVKQFRDEELEHKEIACLLYTSPSPRD